MIDRQRRIDRCALFSVLRSAAGLLSSAERHTGGQATRATHASMGATAGLSSSAERHTGGQASRATCRSNARSRWQWERRLGIEPVEERVLLSVTPTVGPELPTLQTLSTTALVGGSQTQTAQRPWANTEGFLALGDDTFGCVGNWCGDAVGRACFYTGTSAGIALNGSLQVDSKSFTLAVTGVGQATAAPNADPAIARLPPAQWDSGATRQIERLPEPIRTPSPRITDRDLPPAQELALMIDTTPRAADQYALAMAQSEYRQQVAAAQTEATAVALGFQQPVGAPPAPEVRQLHDVRLDAPAPTNARPLNGEQGRAQAFDLAMRPTHRVAPAAAQESAPAAAAPNANAMLAMIDLALQGRPADAREAACDVGEPSTRDAVFAEMSGSSDSDGPVRLDIDPSRRAMAMLVVALLATELAPRSEHIDEGGTYLHPPQPGQWGRKFRR